jgi:hypothetical protein
LCFLFFKAAGIQGAAWPLFILGVLQTGTGYTLYARSDRQRIDTVYAYDMNPAKLKAEEFLRMQKAIKGITIFLAMEFFCWLLEYYPSGQTGCFL